MKKKERVLEFWHVAVIVLAILLFLLLRTSMTGGVRYRDYGRGYGGFDFFGLSFFSFSDIYANYGFVIDAVIFLMIFLGLTQSVFKERFKESRGLYIGMGLFLSFALLLWEENTGTSLLFEFGPFVFFGFIVLLIFVCYRWLHAEFGLGLWTSLALLYLVLFFFFLKTAFFPNAIGWLQSRGWPGVVDIDSYYSLFTMLVGVAILIIIFGWAKRRKS